MRIDPGKVASVGDTLPQMRLAQSAPDMDMRFNNKFLKAGGSSITLEPSVYEKALENKNYRGVHGFVMQDIVPPDTDVEPYVSSLGDFSWRQKVAGVIRARRTGENFLPLPNGYSGTGVPRGSALPSTVTLNPVDANLTGPVQIDDEDYQQEFFVDNSGLIPTRPQSQGLNSQFRPRKQRAK